MATIGHTLAAARIAVGYTVADLSTRTRVRQQVLKAIEAEDFVLCGGDFYARGHIRGICRALKIDPEPLLAEYDRDHANKGEPVFVPLQHHPAATPASARASAVARGVLRSVEDEESMAGFPRFGGDGDPSAGSGRRGHFERRQNMNGRVRRGRLRGAGAPAPRRGRRSVPPDPAPRPAITSTPRTSVGRGAGVRRHWPWAVVGVILVLAVFVGIRTWQDGGLQLRSAVDSGSAPDTIESSVGSSEERGPVQALTVPDAPAPEEPTEFTVGVSASGRSWLKVTDADGGDVFTGFLLDGEAQDYEAEDALTLWLGDAGAVRVTVDGEDIGPVGTSGEVKEVTVGPGGFAG